MFEPIRGGTRGGQAEFKWTDVSADKDRENYLGHSINAPTGRWQKNKDVHWYNRDVQQAEDERAEEIRKVKEAEAEALSVALGFAPGSKVNSGGITPSTSAVAVRAPTTQMSEDAQRVAEKEERRRRKAERKEEKRAKKERREATKHRDSDHRRRGDDSRSRSPRRRSASPSPLRRRSRSRTPPRSRSPPDYDAEERARERERDRRRWDMNSRRYAPEGRR